MTGLKSTARVFTHKDLAERPQILLEQLPHDCFVFNHCDTNDEHDPDGTAIVRFLVQNLGAARVVGNSADFCAACITKSNMCSRFREMRVPTPPIVLVRRNDARAREAIEADVDALLNDAMSRDDKGQPRTALFVKVVCARAVCVCVCRASLTRVV
jgi:hypothetical protein